MTFKESLKEKVEIVIQDILVITQMQIYIEEWSSDKYPEFFSATHSDTYVKALGTIYLSLSYNQISSFGRTLSIKKNEASVFYITKKIINSDLSNTNTDKQIIELKKINDKLYPQKNSKVKKILATRNNIISHSYNEDKLLKSGGSSRPSDTGEISNLLLDWVKLVTEILNYNDYQLKWDSININWVKENTFPEEASTLCKKLFHLSDK